MSLWRQVTRGLRAATQRDRTDREVADEVQHFLEQATAANVARGMSPGDARRAAHLEVGNVTAVQEQVRGYGWENMIGTLVTDLRYAVRRLRAAPGFTAITVLTLALGIGGTTAIFSALNPILFEPLPYPDARRIVMILEAGRDGTRNDGTFGMFRGMAERNRSFDAMAIFKPWLPVLRTGEQPERIEGQRVSAGFLRVLGVPPALGRDFQPADDQQNGPNVVIISDGLWRRRFHADRAIIGSAISLGEISHVVIGVMPKGFENVLAPGAELWAPMQYDMSQGRAWGHHLATVGRLRPGVTIDRASSEIDAIGRAVLQEQRPETYGESVRLFAASLHDEIIAAVKPALLVILGAVTLVLIIACVNVTNLLLARSVHRRGEFAVRAALGAGRGRLVRQVMTESLFLAAAGGIAGLFVAMVGIRALVALSPPGLPRAGAIGHSTTVFVFGFLITTLIGLAFGIIPALQAARSDPQQDLQTSSRRSTGGHRRLRTALVVAEVALAVVLLIGSGLLLRSLQRLIAVPAGFDSSHVMTMRVMASGRRFDDDSTTQRFFAQALEAARTVPGVTVAGFTSQLPMSGDLDMYGVHFEPAVSNDPGDVRGSYRYAVSPGYLEAMRIPLRQGRLLDQRDGAGAPLSVLITESMAKRRLPGINPIGRQLRVGGSPLYTIVGVVGDVKQQSLALSESEAVYIPVAQVRVVDREMSLVVRSGGDAAALTPPLRRAVWSVDAGVPIVRVTTLDDLVTASAAERRFLLILFEAFAVTALVLAAAGIYGVLAGSVAERTREIGVRSALGASRSQVVGLIVRQGMTLTIVGAIIGLAGAAAGSRALGSLLFGISRLDAFTYVGVTAVLLAVAALACWIPAWRAGRVEAVVALRNE